MAETTVSQVQKRGERFHLTTSRGAVEGESLVVATGGPSIPKLGASGYASDLARQFGVAVVLPRPALVPFTFAPAALPKLRPLRGVSADAVVCCAKVLTRAAPLFPHPRPSGPAPLQYSPSCPPGTDT